MTCISALREAARVEVIDDKRYLLRAAAALLEGAVATFRADPTLENLIELNGAWAYSARVLKIATPVVDPNPPMAGAGEIRKAA